VHLRQLTGGSQEIEVSKSKKGLCQLQDELAALNETIQFVMCESSQLRHDLDALEVADMGSDIIIEEIPEETKKQEESSSSSEEEGK
jgi:hypothetical protein